MTHHHLSFPTSPGRRVLPAALELTRRLDEEIRLLPRRRRLRRPTDRRPRAGAPTRRRRRSEHHRRLPPAAAIRERASTTVATVVGAHRSSRARRAARLPGRDARARATGDDVSRVRAQRSERRGARERAASCFAAIITFGLSACCCPHSFKDTYHHCANCSRVLAFAKMA